MATSSPDNDPATSPQSNSPTSTAKALLIPELLGLILSHLPQLDLFVVQRVSSLFSTTILNTPSLQRKMHATYLPENPGSENAELFAQPFPTPFFTPKTLNKHAWFEDNETSMLQLLDSHLSNLEIRGSLEPLRRFSHPPHSDESQWETTLALVWHHGHWESEKDEDAEYHGWRGKSAVHTSGSWEKIGLGVMEMGMEQMRLCKIVCLWSGPVEGPMETAEGKTLGDLVQDLRNLREMCGAVGGDDKSGVKDSGDG